MTTAEQYDGPPSYLSRFIDGGAFIFNVPETIPAVWGGGRSVLWAEGEALMVCGGPGVGKTTLIGQIVRALVFGGDVLGQPVNRPPGRVLYLAMDRPRQIARSLNRQFWGTDRRTVADNLVVMPGPPSADLAKNPWMLRDMALAAGAGTVVLDSLKDATIGLSEDAVGAGYNQARQLALAAGIQVLEAHHQVKRGANGTDPTTLADVYGSAWLTGGAGSVVLLAGKPGDPIVEFRHLKQPADEVGPFRVIHDHDRGESAIWQQADPLAMVRASRGQGITARDLAAATHERDKLMPAELEKARRKLDRLVKDGILTTRETASATKVYVLPGPHAQPHADPHARLFSVDPTHPTSTPRAGPETA